MATAEYHRRQANTLILLANSTLDPRTATQLMKLAAEHTAMAEGQWRQQQQQIQPKKDA
jgi:hypothetical protein